LRKLARARSRTRTWSPSVGARSTRSSIGASVVSVAGWLEPLAFAAVLRNAAAGFAFGDDDAIDVVVHFLPGISTDDALTGTHHGK
jgi:hypothetical protein